MENLNYTHAFGENLDDYLSQAISTASNKENALKKAKTETSNLKLKNPKIRKILDCEQAAPLTLEECQELIAYLIADNSAILEEHKICYMRGLIDGIEMKKTFEPQTEQF